MSRAQRRREARELAKQNKPTVMTLTHEGLQAQARVEAEKYLVDANKKLQERYDEIYRNAVDEALLIMLCFPFKVLKDNYWKKTAPRRLRKFSEQVLDMYEAYLNDEVDIEAIKEDLWEYGGIRLEKINK